MMSSASNSYMDNMSMSYITSPTSSDASFPSSLESQQQLSPTIYVETDQPPSYVPNQELEFLIDAIMSCQEAVYPNLKRQYMSDLEEDQLKIYVSIKLEPKVCYSINAFNFIVVSTRSSMPLFICECTLFS